MVVRWTRQGSECDWHGEQWDIPKANLNISHVAKLSGNSRSGIESLTRSAADLPIPWTPPSPDKAARVSIKERNAPCNIFICLISICPG